MMDENISITSDKSQVIYAEMAKTNKSDTNSGLATGLITSGSLINKSDLNLNDPDQDIHAFFLKFFEDGSESEHIKSLPGISYIIFFAKNVNFFTFDCVVCNPSAGKILSGKGLVKHLRNKTHLLNILKLHDYTLFERYKDTSTEASADLLSEISVCELNSEKEIHMVTAKTYREERKKVAIIVTEMYEVFNMNYEMQNPHAGKSDSSDDEADENNIEVNAPKDTISKEKSTSSALYFLHISLRALASKLAKQQKNRHPQKIVFVIDREEVQFETEQFGKLAKIVKIVNLDFSNAVESLKNQDLIGKGNLFIISCGLNTLITGTASEPCVQMKCSKPLNTYSVNPQISFKDLAFQALKLQEYIFDNSADDQVMFCDIIPTNISSSVRRTCENKHLLRQTTKQEVYINFLSTINEYNKFVDIHCRIFGLKNLNLRNVFFPTKAYNATQPVDHMYDFNEVDDEHVFNSINEFVYNLLTAIDVNMSEMPEIFVFKSVTKSKLSRISALKLFERIVIVTTQQYAPYFQLLKCQQVNLTFARSCKIEDIATTIKNCQKYEPKRTLWLTHMEMFQAARIEYSEMCSSCAKPLEVFIPPSEGSATLSDYVSKIRTGFDALAKSVSSFLDADSSFAVLPPFPLTFLVLEESRHEQYHKIDMERKRFSFITRESMNGFKTFFIGLNKQLISLSLAEFTKANISFQSMADYSELVNSWSSYVDIASSENNQDSVSSAKYIRWLEYSTNLFSENLEFKVNEDKVKLATVIQNPVFASDASESMNSANNYDHIVFICFSKEHALIIPEEEGNAKNISVLVLDSDKSWEDSNKFNEIRSRSFKNILFIIVGSLKLLGKAFQEMYCLKEKCSNPLTNLQLEPFDTKIIVQNTRLKLNLLIKYLKYSLRMKSTVILAPLIALNCTQNPIINNVSSHENIHRCCLDASNLYLLGGDEHRWSKVCLAFHDSWSNEMHNNIKLYSYIDKQSFKNLVNKFKNASRQINIFRFPCTPNSDYYQQYKLLLGDMVELLCPNRSIQNMNFLPSMHSSQNLYHLRSKQSNMQLAAIHSTQRSEPENTSESALRGFANFLSPMAGYVLQNMHNIRSEISQTQPAALYSTQRSDPESTSESALHGFVSSEHNRNSVYSKPSNNHKEFLPGKTSIPDSNFHSTLWNDCVTFGFESSFHYLLDAIGKLIACRQRQLGKVLFISSSMEVLNHVQSRLLLINSVSMKKIYLTVLNEASITADAYDCLLTTLYTLTTYHRDILCRKDIRALIVDDVTKVMETEEDRIAITSAFRRMNLKENTGISKVFVAKFYQPKLPEYLTSIFGIPLIEVKTAECDTTSSSKNWAFQGFREEKVAGYPMSSGQAVEYPTVSRKNRSDNYSTDCGLLTSDYATGSNLKGLSASDGCSYLQSSFVSSNSNKIVHGSRSRQDWQPSSASIGSSSHRRRSCSKTKRKTSHSTRRKETRRRSRHRSHSRSRKHLSSSSRHKRHKSRSESIVKISTMKKRRTKSRSKFRSKSRSSSRSKVYHSKSSLVQTSGRSCRSNSSETICSDINFTADRPDTTLANFSVRGALELVENMSDKMGVIGPVLKSLITNVKLDLVTNQTKALNTIKEEDNIIFFKMTVDKLKKMLLSASLSEISLISKTIEWTTRLMDYAEKAPQQEVNINLKAIAVASMSKPPEFTISLIKSALAYENNETPTKEEVNEIFIKVCSIQCEMMMND